MTYKQNLGHKQTSLFGTGKPFRTLWKYCNTVFGGSKPPPYTDPLRAIAVRGLASC